MAEHVEVLVEADLHRMLRDHPFEHERAAHAGRPGRVDSTVCRMAGLEASMCSVSCAWWMVLRWFQAQVVSDAAKLPPSVRTNVARDPSPRRSREARGPTAGREHRHEEQRDAEALPELHHRHAMEIDVEVEAGADEARRRHHDEGEGGQHAPGRTRVGVLDHERRQDHRQDDDRRAGETGPDRGVAEVALQPQRHQQGRR